MDLQPKKRVFVEQPFYSLAYINAVSHPEACLGMHSPVRGAACIIPAHGWSNIWVYGMGILLTGRLSHEEFRRRASLLNTGMSTFQYTRTRTKNLLVPVGELNLLGDLFERVRAWEAGKIRG